VDRTILVAEGNGLVAEVGTCLGDQYRIVVARDVERVLQVLEHERVDLVVLGVSVGGRGAWEIIPMVHRIRPGMRIVVVAQGNTLEKETAVREQGVFYYAVGPFDPEEIAWVVDEALGHR